MRKDGKRVKNVDPMYTLAAYFMEERNDSQSTPAGKVFLGTWRVFFRRIVSDAR